MPYHLGVRAYAALVAALVCLQLGAGVLRLGDTFSDGRYHYNWGPPFWLEHARATNDIGLAASYWGVAEYHSHPQLIGPLIALWTRAFGYSEYAIRFLALALAICATVVLALAVRRFLGAIPSLLVAASFAALPIVFIYGKKLDQENLVLVFLILQLGAYGIYGTDRRRALILIGITSFLMTCADWPGAVFAAALAIGAGFAFGWRNRLGEYIWLGFISVGAALVAILLFLLQSSLQAHISLGGLLHDLILQWGYRLGTDDVAVTPFWWIYRQYFFTVNNFSLPLFIAGIAGLVLSFRRHVAAEERRIAILSLAVFGGSLAYQLAVAQASGVHIYYQFYYAIPVSIGLYLLARHVSELFPSRRGAVTVALALVWIATAALWSAYQFHSLVVRDMSGEDDDIALISSLRAIPLSVAIVAGQSTSANKAWFENPNISYYAGRDIPVYLLKEGVRIAPYQIIPRRFAPEYLAQINEKHGYGKAVTARSVECSTSFCLLHLHYPQH